MERRCERDPLTESNCYLLCEAGNCVVIDPNRRELTERVAALGLEVEHILLTHEHCDHMAGLEALRQHWPAAPVACTRACSRGLGSPRLNMSAMMEVYLTFRGKPGAVYPPFTCQPAEVTFSRSHTLRWRGHSLRCVPLPGHTPGSMGIFLDDAVFFSGDYLIAGQPVLLRLPGGSRADYEAATRPLLRGLSPGLEICPGHGEPYIRMKEEEEHGL